MNLLNKEFHVEVFDIFGHLVVNVILLVVIVQIYNHQMKMVGFGQDLVQKLDQQVNGTQVIGVIPVDMDKLNQIIVKQPKEMMNHVYQF